MSKVKRWYQGYRCRKKPQDVVEHISRIVQDESLDKYIPLLRIEKGAKARKEYYLFIAVESSREGEIPSSVEDSSLSHLPYLKPAVRGNPPFNYDQIKPMVGVSHEVLDYTNPIPYQVPEKEANDDPFESPIFSDQENINANFEVLSQRYQQLLYWLSAVGSGTWETFKKTCQILGLDYPQRIIRRFRLLGHLEISADGKRWSIAPTALVKVESVSGSQEYFLCGQQSEALLQQLRQYATVDLTTQNQGNSPPCVKIPLTESQTLESLLEYIRQSSGLVIHAPGNSAENLTEILPTLEKWKLELAALPGIVPSLYDWKRFDGNDWLDCIFSGETGMYQMWKLNERESSKDTQDNRPLRTLFYDGDTNTWRQGDWYGLRFLTLHYNDRKCVAHYDPATLRLAVPYSQRFPEIYERALVLASGLLPSYQKTEQNLWLIYKNVGPNLAKQLTQKLYVTLEERID